MKSITQKSSSLISKSIVLIVMSRNVRKPVSAYAINKDANSDQHICCSLPARYYLYSFVILSSCQSLLMRRLAVVLPRLNHRRQVFSCLGSSIIYKLDAYNDCAIIKLSQTYVPGAVSWVMLAEALFLILIPHSCARTRLNV